MCKRYRLASPNSRKVYPMAKTRVRRSGDPLKPMGGRPLLPKNGLAATVHRGLGHDPSLVNGRYILVSPLIERLNMSPNPIYVALRDGVLSNKLARSLCEISGGALTMVDFVDYLR